MATKKYYAYYIEGNSIAIAQRETSTTSTDLRSEDYGKYKSPTETVADGLELKYTYIADYFVETTNDVDQNLTQYQSVDGKLAIADNTSAFTNYATSYGLATGGGDYIELKKAGRFNGLHKISSIGNGPSGTNNKIILATEYSGSESAWTDFEETPELYYTVNKMEDESFELDLPRYLNNAVVFYLKAKVAEDMMDLEKKEYYMREFKKQVEKHSGGKTIGTHRMQGFSIMNRKF
jgi:hypothetical protein